MLQTVPRTKFDDFATRGRPVCLASFCFAILIVAPGSAPAQAQHAFSATNSGEYRVAIIHKPVQRHRHVRRRKARPSPLLKPAWLAKKDSKDPIQIVVSLPERRLTVYRGIEPLVRSRISSGRKGFATPSGVFSILQKNRYHRSNIYSGAPMPYMQRLTWSGIALHGFTSVPRFPASAGCIRLPIPFASKLFRFTNMGAHVVVANEKASPAMIAHDNLIQPSHPAPKDFERAEAERVAGLADLTVKEKVSPVSPLRILITRQTGKERIKDAQRLLNELSFGAGDVDGYVGRDTVQAIRRFQVTYGLDVNGRISGALIERLHEVAGKDAPANGRLYVRRNFKPVFNAPVVIKSEHLPLGAHLFTAMHFQRGDKKVRWSAVTLKKGSPLNAHARHSGYFKRPVKGLVVTEETTSAAKAENALDRVIIPAATRKRLAKMLTPGSSIAISDDGISYETTPKGSDFVVLMQ